MIVGIGTDIVKIARIQASLERFGERFVKKILHATEIETFKTQKKASHFLAKRFAAKEAAVKALGSGVRAGINLSQISVKHDSFGRPFLAFHEEALLYLKKLKVTFCHVSITDEEDYAMAMVILER